jgi:crescentin
MGKISEFLGRTPTGSTTEKLPQYGPQPTLLETTVDIGDLATGNTNGHVGGGQVGKLDANALDASDQADVSAQLGEHNEALRNLLAETGRKISEFEEFKAAFANVVEPAHKALRALEQEKTQNIRLRRALTQTQANYEAQQVKFSDAAKLAAALDATNKQLRRELEQAQEATRELKGSKAEVANELAIARAANVDFERRLAQQTANVRSLSEDNKHLRDQAVESESRMSHLDGEIVALREKLGFTEGDNRSTQKQLDQAVAETTRLTQRLNESEALLAAAKGRRSQADERALPRRQHQA